jgi:hypothetical protein
MKNKFVAMFAVLQYIGYGVLVGSIVSLLIMYFGITSVLISSAIVILFYFVFLFYQIKLTELETLEKLNSIK